MWTMWFCQNETIKGIQIITFWIIAMIMFKLKIGGRLEVYGNAIFGFFIRLGVIWTILGTECPHPKRFLTTRVHKIGSMITSQNGMSRWLMWLPIALPRFLYFDSPTEGNRGRRTTQRGRELTRLHRSSSPVLPIFLTNLSLSQPCTSIPNGYYLVTSPNQFRKCLNIFSFKRALGVHFGKFFHSHLWALCKSLIQSHVWQCGIGQHRAKAPQGPRCNISLLESAHFWNDVFSAQVAIAGHQSILLDRMRIWRLDHNHLYPYIKIFDKLWMAKRTCTMLRVKC